MSFRQSKLITKLRNKIPHPLVNAIYHYPTALGAAVYYDFPAQKLTIIGVTGSNGKTTTVTGIHHLLQLANFKTGMLSTIKAKIDTQEINTGLHVTSPNPWPLQKTLKQMVDKNLTHAVLETTSHGLTQHRFLNIPFQIGIITNITHEHLDYHKTYKNYWKAKAQMFNQVKIAILNHDDQSYQLLTKYLKRKNPQAQIISYSIETPRGWLTRLPRGGQNQTKTSIHIVATNIKQTSKGLAFNVQIKSPNYPKIIAIKTSLIGNFNVENILAVIATGVSLKIKPTIIQKAIATYPPISGRMEIVPHQNKTIIIDFAHTPDAIKKTLQTLIKLKAKNKKLITVFGCAGLRDKTKRPMMGKISAKFANISILTTEDPRTESTNQIIKEIAQGCLSVKAIEITSFAKQNKNLAKHIFVRIPNRQTAITTAIKIAHHGDIIAILGKGHEQSMCFGTTEIPWSDKKAIHRALKT